MKNILIQLNTKPLNNLQLYRMLLITGAVLIPLLGNLLRWLDPSATEPMTDRYILAGLFFTAICLSYTTQYIRNRLQDVIHLFYYLLSIDFLYSLYLNNFKMEYFVEVMGLLMVTTALGFKNKRCLWAYLVFVNLSILGIMCFSESVSFNKEFTFISLAMTSSVVAFASGLNMDVQKRLEETEAIWRSVFKDAGDHIMLIDKERRIQHINYTTEGHQPEDIIGMDILSFMPPEEHDKIQAKINQALGGEKATYSTIMNNPVTNKPIHYLSTASPLKNNDEIIGVVFMARDITEQIETQKRLERKNKELTALQIDLAESRERIKKFLEGLPVGVYAIDKNGEPFYANNRAVQILGKGIVPKLSRQDLSETYQAYVAGSQHLYPAEDMPIVKALQGKTVTIEDMEIQKGLKRIPLEVTGRPIYNSQGEIEYALAIFTDITERKKSMKLLADFTSALDSSACITRADKNGVITYANEYFCRLSGYSAEELIGQAHSIVSSGYHSQEFFQDMWETISSGKVWKGEIKNKAKNGKFFWQMKSIVPVMGEDGHIREFVSVSANVTQHRELENKLRKAKKEADKAGQAKSHFLATMSHEIRTPMNAVIGMTGLLMETELTNEQLDYVETIKLGGENLLTVINDILDFSKIDSGKLELEEHEFDLAESIEDVLDLVAANAVKKDIELMYKIKPEVPRIIKCDSTRLRQVLLNLLTNAIKFTSNKGEVIVSAENDDEINSYKILKFAVKDTGIGIPRDKLNVLFKAFSQVDASTTRKYGGTGLGLAICKKLVNFMGGDIWVESEEGKGSTFYFTIRVKVVSARNDNTSTKELCFKSILIVDDNETNLRILQSQCESWGMEVTATTDPIQALSFIKESQAFDLVILDMQMPEMDGVELTKAIRQYYSKEELPIVMLTSIGFSIDEEAKALLSTLISKPVKQSQLGNILYHQLQKKEEEKMEMIKANNNAKNGSVRILIVEDNPINQKVVTRILDKLGYSADIAGNGFEAMDALNFKRYDLIFMDVQMPEMDGLEATRRIKKAKNGSAPLIIGMTAHAMKTDRDKCLEAGMDDYLAKPVQLQKINEVIEKWFPGEAIIKAS